MKFLKQNAFTLWLLVVVGLALFFPQPAASGGFLIPELTTQLGVWLIFFLQGLSLPTDELTRGYKPKRLHAFVLSWNFLWFPVVTGVVLVLLGWLLSSDLRLGFWLLAIMPTTVASAIAFTALAGGKTANAIFSTVYSNVLAIWVVPAICVAYLAANLSVEVGLLPLFAKLATLILVPLVFGQMIHRIEPVKSAAIASRTKWVSQAIILFIVHAAFADSVQSGFAEELSVPMLIAVIGLTGLLLLFVCALVWWSSALLKFEPEQRIAGFFCASQKSLATGLPLATSIIAATNGAVDAALLLIPMLCYHPLQLVLAGVLSGRFSASN